MRPIRGGRSLPVRAGRSLPIRGGRSLPIRGGRSLLEQPLRRYRPAAVALRVAILLVGLALLMIPAERNQPWTVLTLLGVLVAASSPDQAGDGLALASAIGGWLSAYGLHGSPPLVTTAAFALALYLLHTSTALAAAVPLSSQLRSPVLRRWLRRCLIELAVAAALAAAGYGLSRPGSSSAVQLLGLLGVLALVAAAVLLQRSHD